MGPSLESNLNQNLKLLIIGDKARVEKYLPAMELVGRIQRIVLSRGSSDVEILTAAADANFIMADAISPVSAELMAAMPALRLIHSEGVAYNAIDTAAARSSGIYVCNCKGVNAAAVAEQAVLLMLACLRDAVNCDAALRGGQQIQTKERMMAAGFKELGDCKIGFIGAGDIAQATMRRLAGWGCDLAYFKRSPLTTDEEQRLGAAFEALEQLLASSDIVSIHVPVTAETENMVDAEFLAAMKPGSILINTARGEIVHQEALAEALVSGHLAAAGLDTLSPEPVSSDHILLNLPQEASRRIVFSPHIGGVSEGTFYRAHRMVWENIARVVAGDAPINIVNRLG